MTDNLLFDKSLKKINLLLKCTGTNIDIGEAIPKNTVKKRSIYIINFIWLNTDVIGAVCWFIVGLRNKESFTQLTYVAPCVTLSFLADIKSLFLIIYEKNVYELMENLRAMEIRVKRVMTKERERIIKDGVNFLNYVVNVLYLLNILLVVAFALQPTALMLLKYMKTKEIEYVLPFFIVYPFDPYDIKVWPIVYVRQIWSEIVVVINICVPDFLFYNFCSYITIQFRLLQHDIENVIIGKMHTSDFTDDYEVRNKLVGIIKWHQELIWCVNLLDSIYAKSTLYNFVSSSFIICLTGFNVTENKDVILVITFLTFLFMGLLQIFFLCFFGDMLMNASIDVSDAVYNSKWYLASPKMRRSLLLILTRALNPCKLTAFGFADVSLRAFMKILSTSWSYFALLKTLYSTE